MAIKHENDEFLVISLKHISVLRAMQIDLENPKLWTITHENNKFLVITLELVSVLKVAVNRPTTTKLRAIAHENSHKTENDELSVISLKHVSGLTGHGNLNGNPKLRAKKS